MRESLYFIALSMAFVVALFICFTPRSKSGIVLTFQRSLDGKVWQSVEYKLPQGIVTTNAILLTNIHIQAFTKDVSRLRLKSIRNQP